MEMVSAVIPVDIWALVQPTRETKKDNLMNKGITQPKRGHCEREEFTPQYVRQEVQGARPKVGVLQHQLLTAGTFGMTTFCSDNRYTLQWLTRGKRVKSRREI